MFLVFSVHCISKSCKHAVPIDVFSNKCFISKYKIEDAKSLYQIVKELAGEHDIVNRPPMMLKDGTQAATHEQQMKRWQEHFAAVLNCPEPDVLHEFENDIPTLQVNTEAITKTELARAVSKLKNGKAAGTDHIQPQLLKQSYHT